MTSKEQQLVRRIHNLVQCISSLQENLRFLQLELRAAQAGNSPALADAHPQTHSGTWRGRILILEEHTEEQAVEIVLP